MIGAALGVLAIIGIVAGIHNKDTPAPVHPNAGRAVSVPGDSSTPAGYTTFRSSADRFSVAIPDTWKSVDITSPGAQAAIDAMEQSNPKLGSAFGQSALSMAESGMVLMAINPTPSSADFADNVNIVAHPDLTYSDGDLNQIASSLPGLYSKLGARFTGTSFVTLDGRRALRATDKLSLNIPGGGNLLVDQAQYFVGANDIIFEITLTGDDPALAEIAATFSTS